MKLIFLIGIVFWIAVSLEAKREREGTDKPGRQVRDREREVEQVDGNRLRGCHWKEPFPMFPSCKDFNEGYARKMKGLCFVLF